jgi:hypothetical protein
MHDARADGEPGEALLILASMVLAGALAILAVAVAVAAVTVGLWNEPVLTLGILAAVGVVAGVARLLWWLAEPEDEP